MNDSQPSPRRALDLFDEIVELPLDERSERLAAIAVDDPALAREVAQLIAADEAAGAEFLARPALQAAPTLADEALAGGPGSVAEGSTVGAWRLVQPLGAGGMGEVWEVGREGGGFEQRGALKLLKRGLDSDEILRRFRAERQILAQLSHPAIAHVYDGGVAPDGRPFFVMELVRGEPLTDHCQRRRLSVEERLALFLTVCDAVEAAHRSLVVHRDLKPSNVLVTAAGEVKLLDFGIAKLLADDGDAAATRAWERFMTPAYAAPEQILGEPVTTATDVYSLGVVLYELLAGRLPHRRRGAGSGALAAEVAGETVERPSTAVRRRSPEDDREVLSELERERRGRRLRGDLDWIVLRALAREPDRRYHSAAALAADLRRHLAGQPVEARPDSVGYRAGKFMRRHRLAVAAAALVLLAVVGGLAVALVQAERARREAVRATRVRDFLVSIFESIDPERAQGATLTARDVVAEGARRFDRELAGEPEVQAELYRVLARAERSLGLYESALARAREAQERSTRLYGADDPRAADAAATAAGVLGDQGQLDASERHARDALAAVDTGTVDGELAAARLEAVLGSTLHQLWRLPEAEELLRRVAERREGLLGREHPDTVAALLALAAVLGDSEQFAAAEPLYLDLLPLVRRVHGEGHPTVAAVEAGYAAMLDTLKRFDEAERRYLVALELRRRAYGTEVHTSIASLHQLLAILYRRTRRLDEAEREARLALDLYRQIDPGHYEIANSYGTLAMVALSRGAYAEALPRMQEALAATEAAEGEDSFFAHARRANVAGTLVELGRFAEAEALAARALAGYARHGEAGSTYASNTLVVHGAIARGDGRFAKAIERHRQARAIRVELYGEPHVEVDGADLEIAVDLLERGEPGDLSAAQRLLPPILERCREPANAASERCELALVVDARLDLATGRAADARADLEEAVRRIGGTRGEGHPLAAESRAYLGQALIATGEVPAGRQELQTAIEVLAAARGPAHPLVMRLRAAAR